MARTAEILLPKQYLQMLAMMLMATITIRTPPATKTGATMMGDYDGASDDDDDDDDEEEDNFFDDKDAHDDNHDDDHDDK